MLITYIISSHLVDKTDRIGIFRLSMFLWAGIILFFILLGDKIEGLLWLVGFLFGIVKGFNWSSYNVIKQEMVGKSSMEKFSTYSRAFYQLVRVLFPITLGAIIDTTSYQIAAMVVLIFIIFEICISFMIKSKRPQNSKFDMKGWRLKLKENNSLSKRLKFIYILTITYGSHNVLDTLISIYIMILYGSNFSLGTITSIISILTILEIFLVGRFTKPGKRVNLYLTSAVLPVLSVILFVIVPVKSTIIIFNIVLSFSGAIFKLIYDVYRNKFLKESGGYEYIAEHHCVVESILQIVRTINDALLIFVALTQNLMLVQSFLIIFTIIYSLNSILLLVFEKKFFPKNVEKLKEIKAE